MNQQLVKSNTFDKLTRYIEVYDFYIVHYWNIAQNFKMNKFINSFWNRIIIRDLYCYNCKFSEYIIKNRRNNLHRYYHSILPNLLRGNVLSNKGINNSLNKGPKESNAIKSTTSNVMS